MSAVLFQTMPPLSVEEYSNLEQSIRDHGIQVPVLVDEDGVVIDGHHRQKIAQQLGLDCPTETRNGMSESEKRSLSISLNIDRRQLSQAQRRAIIEASLKATPELSDNQISKQLGVHNETVTAARKRLVESGDVTDSVTRTDSLGRQQPASKPAPEQSWSPESGFNAHPFTGEIIEQPAVVTETHTVKVVTGPPSLPPAPKLAKPMALQNAEQASQDFGGSIRALIRTTTPEGRQVILNAWSTGADACTPDVRDHTTAAWFRIIARGLNTLANEWESK